MMRSRLLVSGVLVAAVALSGCDGNSMEPPPGPSSPTAAPTAVLASNIEVSITPPRGSLSPQQREVLAAYVKYINARNRFDSHPWIIDPELVSSVLPTSTDAPVLPDSIGLIGPVTIEILSVTVTAGKSAEVDTCADHRGLRYLGRDGAIDIIGPGGDRLRDGVSNDSSSFEKTTAAAVDGTKSTTPRWLVSNGGTTSGTPQCKALAASPEPSSTPRSPITATP
jgi:hypothetical protein